MKDFNIEVNHQMIIQLPNQKNIITGIITYRSVHLLGCHTFLRRNLRTAGFGNSQSLLENLQTLLIQPQPDQKDAPPPPLTKLISKSFYVTKKGKSFSLAAARSKHFIKKLRHSA